MAAKLFRISYSVWDVFNNFLLIDATDRSKISIDQKRFFIALSLYPLSFFADTPFIWTLDFKYRVLLTHNDTLFIFFGEKVCQTKTTNPFSWEMFLFMPGRKEDRESQKFHTPISVCSNQGSLTCSHIELLFYSNLIILIKA